MRIGIRRRNTDRNEVVLHGARAVPTLVEQIAEVPRTMSGKALELPVKRILLGAPAETTVSRDALANPAALEPFEEMARSAPYST